MQNKVLIKWDIFESKKELNVQWLLGFRLLFILLHGVS